jgi:hypothetical protein
MIRVLAKWLADKLDMDAAAAVPPQPPLVGEERTRGATELVWTLHPVQCLRFLEEAWAYRLEPLDRPDLALPPGLLYGVSPGLEAGVAELLSGVGSSMYDPLVLPRPTPPVDTGRGATWDHLIYAYFVENTRIIDIFRRVMVEFLHGERLEVPSLGTRRWLRVTEDLFFRDLASGSIGAITSSVRPDPAAVRRNAYLRLFGMDLNHGKEEGQAYPYVRPTAINSGFVPMFEDFLREVWIAEENYLNKSGANPKDDAAIANYARDMKDMLRTRRQQGNLAREEFWIVTLAAWFHLTVESNNSVVTDLKSTADSPEERLRKIGERVNLPPHIHSESFFTLAQTMSTLLRRLEAGDYSNPSAVSVLYTENTPPAPPNPIRKDMLDIINQWSTATGRDMKARRTTVTARLASGQGQLVGTGSNGGVRR